MRHSHDRTCLAFPRIILIPLFIIIFITTGSTLFAAEPVQVNDARDIYPLGLHLEYLEDVNGLLTIHDITGTSHDYTFHPSKEETPNFAFTDSVYWVRFTLRTDSLKHKHWILKFGYPLMDHISLYEVRPDRKVLLLSETGFSRPFSTRQVPHRFFLFHLDPGPGETRTYYLRLRNQDRMEIPLTLESESSFQASDHREQYILGIYFGIILFICIFNLFIFVSIRDISYLYYILFVLGFGFFQLIQNGTLQEYFWPSFLEKYNHVIPFSIAITLVTLILFTRSFLDTKKLYPAFNRYFTGLAVFTAVSITFQLFLKYSIAVQIQVALSLLTLGSVVTVGSVGVFRKSRPARYFMGSWLIILFGGIIYAFKVLAVLPTNTFTTYALQIGSVIQFILLALGLGDRINVIKMEKDRAQQDAIRSQQMAIENLSKADRLKDEFLANTSHELKTPLVGIIGMAESLIDGAAGPMTAEMKYNLSMISSSGLRLSSLINDILDYSKMKNSTLELRRRPVDLHQLADLVFVMARTLLRGKLIELKNDVPEGLPLVFADENRLQQIFFNLVGNAIKFTDRGHVRITAAARDLHAGTHMVEVRVEDTGIGIPHNRQGDIFRSFEQVDASISREYGGTGLGLSITKKLIELHNGGIWVESEPGKGSSFIFTIPVSENQSTIPADTAGGEVKAIALQELPPLPAISGEGSARILVVDDELINLQVLSNQLLLEKHRVILATNGEDAIKLIAENPPDMVVLDIMMPCMSGLEVCRRLRETYSLHELPVLMLTAKNQLNDIIAGFEAGANDYLAKPFDKRELIARVNTLLSLRDAIEKNNSLLVMQKELEIAKRILQSILPDGPPVMKKLAIYTRYLPMDRVGGDFFDFHVLDEDRIGVFTADVSGHGVPSAIIAAMLKVAFSLQKSIAREPDELLREINHILRGKFGKSFITAIYAYIDMVAGTLSGSNAGHFPIVIHRKQDGTIHEFMPKGWAIGIRGEPMLTREEFALAAGDRIVLFTDGIIEARNKAGDLFGYETFLGHIGTQRHLPPREFADFIIARMSEWTGQGDRFDDDVTLLVIDVADDYVKAG